MTDEYRNAKADAKAEKARAKAMRPWFKKKRFMIPLVIVVLGIAASAAGSGGGNSSDNDASSNDTASNGVSDFSTNGDHPPADDVTITACRKTVIDTVEVDMDVTNHSSKESDYTITLTMEDSSGNKVGDGFASTSNVDAGQTSKVQGVATLSEPDADFSCSVEEVERFAS